jgi:hypothetical protein
VSNPSQTKTSSVASCCVQERFWFLAFMCNLNRHTFQISSKFLVLLGQIRPLVDSKWNLEFECPESSVELESRFLVLWYLYFVRQGTVLVLVANYRGTIPS